MSYRTYHPDRGDFVHLNFSPSAGHEMADPHYALVLNPRAYSRKSGMAIVCAITSHIRGGPFEVRVPAGLLPPKAGVGIVESVVVADAVGQVDYRERSMTIIAKAPAEIVEEVLEKLTTLLEDE